MTKDANKKFNPQMLTIARESRGMLQLELAEAIEVSKSSANRMEQDLLEASPVVVGQLSKVLNYPEEFFYQKGEILPLALSYRKRDNVPARILSQIEANITIYRLNIERLLLASSPVDVQIPILDVLKLKSPEECAKELRKLWKLPKGPIEDLSEVLEAKGIMLISFDFETDRVDGRFMILLEKFPVIITNKRLLGDRQRFTLAYQLGHLVMHQYTSPGFGRDLSHEANLFAAEFLMPEKDIKPDLEGLTLQKLAVLKKKWKVSMQALLYRASNLQLLSVSQKNYLLQQFNQQNIRRREPKELDITIEQYKSVRDLITQYRTKQKLTVDKLASFLHLSTEDFFKRYTDKT
jgi:Zn-dependent peptidase ImmA (M78 family)/DNA-binding XRE family transcriptional regulator